MPKSKPASNGGSQKARKNSARMLAGNKPDESGMAWWNRLTKGQRAEALAAANTKRPAEAWRWHRDASTSGNVEMLGPVDGVVYTNVQAEGAFALRVENDEMVSGEGESFPRGCFIIVDPTKEARYGDYVIVRLKDAREAIFRTLEQDGATPMLRPLNPKYPSTPLPADSKIVGVVAEKQELVQMLEHGRERRAELVQEATHV